jgi:hypothetical protein
MLPPPRRSHGGAWLGALAITFGFSLPLFSRQVDVAAFIALIRDWTITRIHRVTADLDQLVCVVKSLRRFIEPTAGGGSAFIAQVTLYSAAYGVAIILACYATGEIHERAVLE